MAQKYDLTDIGNALSRVMDNPMTKIIRSGSIGVLGVVNPVAGIVGGIGNDLLSEYNTFKLGHLLNGLASGFNLERRLNELYNYVNSSPEKAIIVAICMTCGRVGSWKNRPTFEELAIMFEGSTASGAERAYRKAVDKLTELLVAEDAIHAVRLKQKSKTKRKKKIAAAIYEYQADCDGEWGEISVDFENGTAEIIRLADWDTMKTNRFANKVIAYLLNCENEKLPTKTMLAFEP